MTKTWYYRTVNAVILHLALCWKHNVKESFLRQTSKTIISPKMTKFQNVKFHTNIKNRIIFRYYFDSISTFRYTSNRMFSKKNKKQIENCHDRAVELLLRLCAKFQLMARPHIFRCDHLHGLHSLRSLPPHLVAATVHKKPLLARDTSPRALRCSDAKVLFILLHTSV